MISSVVLDTYSRRCFVAKRTSVPQYCFCCWATSNFPLSFTLLASKEKPHRA